MKIKSWIWRIVLWLTFILLILAGLIWGMLQFPSVQTKVIHEINHRVSRDLQAEVSIGNVDIKFFKRFLIQDILIKDPSQDTLIFAQKLSADISVFSLFRKTILLKNLRLIDAQVNLARLNEASYNFDFLLKASKKKSNNNQTKFWNFGLDQILLDHVVINFIDKEKEKKWEALVNKLQCDFETFDLKNKRLLANSIFLNESYLMGTSTSSNLDDVDTITPTRSITFPTSEWDIKVTRFESNNNAFSLLNNPTQKVIEGISPNDISMFNLYANMNNLRWQKDKISADISQLKFKEKKGFQLDNFTATLNADSSSIEIKDLNLKTPQTKISNTTKLQFASWDQLITNFQQSYLEASFQQSQIATEDLKLLKPFIGTLPYYNYKGSKNIFLEGMITGEVNDFSVNNLQVNLDDHLKLSMNGDIKNISQLDHFEFDLGIKKFATSYEGLYAMLQNINLPETLKAFGDLQLAGHLKGSINDFQITKIDLSSSTHSSLKTSGRIKNLFDKNRAYLDLVISVLETTPAAIASFIPTGLPTILDSLENIQYSGGFTGGFTAFNLDGSFLTNLGDLGTNVALNFNQDYSSLNYSGNISSKRFALGTLIGSNTEIGAISLNTFIEGQGLQLDSLVSRIQGKINTIEYKNYSYSDILINGNLAKRKFDGHLMSADPNALLDFSGVVDLSQALPDFKFEMNVAQLNLKKINLSLNDIGVKSKIKLDLTGRNLDNLNGTINIVNLEIEKDSLLFNTDSIVVIADQNTVDNKRIIVKSDFFNTEITGQYELSKLPTVVKNIIEEFIPLDTIDDHKIAIDSTTTSLPDYMVDINLEMLDPTPITIFFAPQLIELDSLSIMAKLNSASKIINVEGNLSNIDYRDVQIENISIKTVGNPSRIHQQFGITGINVQDKVDLHYTTIDCDLIKDSLDLSIEIVDGQEQQKLNFGGIITHLKEIYSINFKERFVLNGNLWKIAPGNNIQFKKDFLEINKFNLEREGQRMMINSMLSTRTSTVAPVEIQFDKFHLEEIFQLISEKPTYLSGLLNGKLIVKDLTTNPQYNIDLDIPMLKVDGYEAGTLQINATQEKNQPLISLLVDLSGERDALRAWGEYNVATGVFAVKADVSKLEMQLLDPYLQGFVNDSKGSLSGSFDLSGSNSDPKIRGSVQLKDVSTIIDYTNTGYKILNQNITFDNNSINLGELHLTDHKNRPATLSGNIFHEFFTNFRLNLGLNTEEFQFLDTKEEDNSLFYGSLFLRAKLKIVGPIDNPTVDITAKTLPNSTFTLSPFSQSDIITEEDYIIFGNPETYQSEDTILASLPVKNAFPFDVNLNLELTDDANFQFIVDPFSGDKLVCKGASNLIINMRPSGEMQMYGIYTISTGNYEFSYSDFIKREFTIRPGSTVAFNGDPLNARFNVIAERPTRTTTYELISNETNLSSAEIQEAQTRQIVNVILKLNGTLKAPVIAFDLQLPENEGTLITSTLERKLDALRNDPNELNKQVFGLLLVNSFILSSSISSELLVAGETALLSSVSKLFTNQLNRLAGKYIKGLELTVDVNAYKSEFLNEGAGGTVTEVGLGVTKRLFDDRLRLQATGNVDVNSTDGTSSLSSLAGDFLLEYKLTEKGHYLLKVFRKSNYDVLQESDVTKNGVGLSYKKSFDRKKKEKVKLE